MSHDVLSPETHAKDAMHRHAPEDRPLAGPIEGCTANPFAMQLPGKVDPEAAAHVMAHYADVHPAPALGPKVGPDQKAGPQAKQAPQADVAHTGLGAKIDELAAKSPTLEHDVEALQKKGWAIRYGHKGKGTFADPDKKAITVDPIEKGHPLALLRSLAHEAGHAMHKPGAYVGMDGLNRQQYVDRNVHNELNDEGDATINNLHVREELLKAKVGDIGISGAQSKKYLELYKKYPHAKDHDKLREEIGKVYATGEHPSNAPKENYGQYYATPYADAWDKAHPAAKK